MNLIAKIRGIFKHKIARRDAEHMVYLEIIRKFDEVVPFESEYEEDTIKLFIDGYIRK